MFDQPSISADKGSQIDRLEPDICDGSAVCLAAIHIDHCRSQMTWAELCAEEDEDAARQATRDAAYRYD